MNICPRGLSVQHTGLEGHTEPARLTDKPQSKSEKVATAEEISEAIEKLLPDEWAKLYAYADNRARMMALYGAAVEGKDLVQKAVIAMLEARRSWNPKKVTFPGVLMGAMKSIASNHKAKSLTSGYSVPESQLPTGGDDDEAKTLAEFYPDYRLNPEQQMVASEVEEDRAAFTDALYGLFGEDLEALLVMDCWKEGLSGSDIIKTLEIDRKGYETIVRRIRRKSNARWSRGNSHVS
jgi:DNA-directed RNA polymerase specialized sigma24 family protein